MWRTTARPGCRTSADQIVNRSIAPEHVRDVTHRAVPRLRVVDVGSAGAARRAREGSRERRRETARPPAAGGGAAATRGAPAARGPGGEEEPQAQSRGKARGQEDQRAGLEAEPRRAEPRPRSASKRLGISHFSEALAAPDGRVPAARRIAPHTGGLDSRGRVSRFPWLAPS